jgi:hypothetical protein
MGYIANELSTTNFNNQEIQDILNNTMYLLKLYKVKDYTGYTTVKSTLFEWIASITISNDEFSSRITNLTNKINSTLGNSYSISTNSSLNNQYELLCTNINNQNIANGEDILSSSNNILDLFDWVVNKMNFYNTDTIPILDTSGIIPLKYIPELSYNKTYVQHSNGRLSTIPEKNGDKFYELDTGDTYIWGNEEWNIQSDADWANINIDWGNIIGRPTSICSDIDSAVLFKHEHSNKVILDNMTSSFTIELNNNISDLMLNIHSHINKTILDNITEPFTTAILNKITTNETNISNKTNKIIPTENNNIAGLNAEGDLIDLNSKTSEFCKVYNDEYISGTFEKSNNQKILITKNSPGEDGGSAPLWANENDIIFVYEENI